MIKISKYLDPTLVTFLDVDTRDEVLYQLVEMVYNANLIKDKEAFYQAIIEREKIVSTGIGMGVALPHAKLASYDHFFIAIAVLRKGIDWNALDHAPVRIIFMIGGPDDKQTEYLQILSSLTLMLKDEQRRKKMLTLNSGDAILALFDET
ncbi:PTS sugar transporter subunit IIA [Parachlamydia sp. AcF125]|uniref:PTS sugar transporter subunit IIA n=1 Tax=Parachlamydia sp. AcF125 TaxID=2795736 RepID=UPI001BCA65DB|nr:PTS sugar transporter subunit IIA [Parachlamydia sp. AcF125]MBS4168071.1 PTS system fructose-specific EIIABC component [Parachlamydia sp. AcF125]